MRVFSSGILVEHTPCRPKPLNEICRSIAIVHAEFLLIHPFREGNGRVARWLADIMAIQAGYPMPVYHFHGKGSHALRGYYLQAVTQGYYQRYDLLSRFFEDAMLLGEADAVADE